ncbi:hypothetical protein PN498_12615 [Oscillatoria sp. CS-180]|uniref:ImmA/IrrE family metallo-endopeptidase n=1 Tax=Oscillatoria sp. CS-180 TaxID=3021720 RepID=UPI002330575E|nr:hypothetical protein [Oscillatoria sp. CS-180]MDB9526834.1 hypothetical protein [Oscillatoria sp. CS-180]
MSALGLEFEWLTSGNGLPEIQQTMGLVRLIAGDINLTRNEDIWSRTIRDTVLVSAYPLAEWIASSWWRLLYEPLPARGTKPSVDWRMAHEITAANHGFIWPRVILASDTEWMQVWSTISNTSDQQSVRYINSLAQPFLIKLIEFEQKARAFIESVISRLAATEISSTPLANLWQEVQEELSEPYARRYRRCEAELGFDPDECPEELVKDALDFAERMGGMPLSEIAPAYSRNISEAKPLSAAINDLTQASGLEGKPETFITQAGRQEISKAPWQTANARASALRNQIGLGDAPVRDNKLYDLLGLQQSEYETWIPLSRQTVALAVPTATAGLNFHFRKRHPVARRFELARFIGDFMLYGAEEKSWLASTDLRTSRQKYQRAFAAEFLCPLDGLLDYLDGDYSETALEDAAEYFSVSQQTVELILANNSLMATPQPNHCEDSLPY